MQGRANRSSLVPTELRRIVFTNDELRQALDAHIIYQQSKKLPMGLITSAKLSPDQTKVVLGMYDPRTETKHLLEVSAGHAAAALLRYCFAHRVPLPKDATKSLIVSGDNIALDIRREAGGQAAIVSIDQAKQRPAKTAS